jgi:hypothetical protein
LDGRLIRFRDFVVVMVELGYVPDPLCSRPAVDAKIELVVRDINTTRDCKTVIDFVSRYEAHVASKKPAKKSATTLTWVDLIDDERRMILSLWQKNQDHWLLYSDRIIAGITLMRDFNIGLIAKGESTVDAEIMTKAHYLLNCDDQVA